MGFCGKDKQYTDKPQWFDPLGPTAEGKQAPTGGPEQRARIYDEMTALAPSMSASAQQATSGLQSAAADSGWGDAANLARKTINGEYLGGTPQFNQALGDYRAGVGKAVQSAKQGAQAEAADSTANIRSQFGRAGMGFSTGNQQAAQAAQAAGTARANELGAGLEHAASQYEAGARLQNNQFERAAQMSAPGQLQDALSTPINYLSSIPQTAMAPLAQQSQLVGALSGGGPIATPNSTIVRQPGVYDYMLSTAGAVMPNSVSL